jgi:hypothetical protein
MKKKAMFFGFILVCLILLPTLAMAATGVTMIIGGVEAKPDVPAYIENGRTMVPIRIISENLGATVDWNTKTKQVTIVESGKTVVLAINSTKATINGSGYTLESPAVIKNGRTMVPIRFIAEGINYAVDWDNTTKTATINKNTADTGTGNETAKEFQYLGYYYSQSSLSDSIAFNNELTGVIHFAYQLSAEGGFTKKANFDTDKFYCQGGGYENTRNADIDALMLITGFSKSTVTTVLSDPALRAKTVNQIAETINVNGLEGVDLDFESVAVSQRENFVTFVKEIRAKIGKDKIITLSLMPRSKDSQYWYDGYDYYGLSQVADYIIIMCYNEHWSSGSPGPVASVDWVESVIQYTLGLGVDKSKFVIALGSYGYDWPEGKSGASLTNTSARNRAAKYGSVIMRDRASECLFYTYKAADGIKHTVWFEDSVSLGKKAALAKEYDLGGIAMWRLGFYTTEIWSELLDNTEHPNAKIWQGKAAAETAFPYVTVDKNGGISIENNGDFIPQS